MLKQPNQQVEHEKNRRQITKIVSEINRKQNRPDEKENRQRT
jgi:hypothetical protein